ncbi:hypothetical protein [Actinomadura violacea]|uniref:Uncharacterized protein n=1 Tax=Actinomadura violacea TaxID=2819934 RepID=A0ABS3S9T6_9ACTN|nr:hypothetical protein [Actinomadura violacea]MBO2465770.1 hypothetical protein [Actinomadura violacea]
MALIIGGAMTISLMFGILLGAVFAPTLDREGEHPGRTRAVQADDLQVHRSGRTPSSHRAGQVRGRPLAGAPTVSRRGRPRARR